MKVYTKTLVTTQDKRTISLRPILNISGSNQARQCLKPKTIQLCFLSNSLLNESVSGDELFQPYIKRSYLWQTCKWSFELKNCSFFRYPKKDQNYIEQRRFHFFPFFFKNTFNYMEVSINRHYSLWICSACLKHFALLRISKTRKC